MNNYSNSGKMKKRLHQTRCWKGLTSSSFTARAMTQDCPPDWFKRAGLTEEQLNRRRNRTAERATVNLETAASLTLIQ